MGASKGKDSSAAFAKNISVLGYAVLGKAAVSLAMSLLTSNIMLIDLASSALFVIALCVLFKIGALSTGMAPAAEDIAEVSLRQELISGLQIIAVFLAGHLLCQCLLGMGWAGFLFNRYSTVLQTGSSFAFVQCGSILCGAFLVLARNRFDNIMNFRYYAVLGCLLLLVVPWISADLAGDTRMLITALPWGFSSSLLTAIVVTDLANMRVRAILALSAFILALNVGAILLSGAGLVFLGDDIVNAIWRTLLILLIALSGLDILWQYQQVEKRLEETSVRPDYGKIDGYKLTNREKEVLAFWLQGRRATWIAQKLYISDNTVRAHVKHIYQKLGVHTREELIDFMSAQ